MNRAEYNRRVDAATEAHTKAVEAQRRALAKAGHVQDATARSLAYDVAIQSYAAATEDYRIEMELLSSELRG